MNDNLTWLFAWFYHQCDGDWEHGKGVQIGTLSNPGWFIKIDIAETELQDKEFKKVFLERSDQDWYFCTKQNGFFEGNAVLLICLKFCKFLENGPKNLKKE